MAVWHREWAAFNLTVQQTRVCCREAWGGRGTWSSGLANYYRCGSVRPHNGQQIQKLERKMMLLFEWWHDCWIESKDEWNASTMNGKWSACGTQYFSSFPHYHLHWQDYRQINRYQTRGKYTTGGHNNVYDWKSNRKISGACCISVRVLLQCDVLWHFRSQGRVFEKSLCAHTEREHAFVIYSAWDAAARLHTWQGAERTARQEN